MGVTQFYSTVALRASARPGAWVRLIPAGVASSIERRGAQLPVPQSLRLLLAREALARGESGTAAGDLARLHPSRERSALAGRLAEARGDLPGAVRAYLAAGDLAALEAEIAAVQRRGDLHSALNLQQEAIVVLQADRTQPDALAQAFYGLGLLRQAQAYRLPAGSTAAHANEMASSEAYARAVALAPLDERYLLGLGNEQLNLGEWASAQRTFARAREADPTIAEPLTGLGEVEFRRGNRAAALAYLARARELNPGADAVRNLARKLGG